MIYKHFTGDYYQVLGTALDSITGNDVIVYRALYSCEICLFTRPKDEFFDIIEKNGKKIYRFKQVNYDDLPDEIKKRYDLPFKF